MASVFLAEEIVSRAQTLAELRAVLANVKAEVLALERRRGKLLALLDAYGLVIGHQEGLTAIEAAFLEFRDEDEKPDEAPAEEGDVEHA